MFTLEGVDPSVGNANKTQQPILQSCTMLLSRMIFCICQTDYVFFTLIDLKNCYF